MGLLKTQKNKNVLLLAIISAIASVLFSFLGAPFLRALFVSTKSVIFWTTAVLLIGVMFVVGKSDYKILETAIYVGSIWMTLGTYSELEKRGQGWLNSGLISLSAGLFFALAGYFLILKKLTNVDLLAEIVQPLTAAINIANPGNEQTPELIISVLPGLFVATLLGSLVLSFVYEDKVVKMFGIQREKVASGIRWLEFRLPSGAIWITLSAFLYLELSMRPSTLYVIGINILIVLTAAFFFQGIAIVSSMLRAYQAGPLFRTVTYVLIILQLAPLVVFAGFVDYWVDIRRRVRKKIKTT